MKLEKQVKILELFRLGKYSCTPDGCVFGAKGNPIKSWQFPRHKYRGYTLYIADGKKLTVPAHQLIFLGVKGAYTPGMEINHKDGNPHNNAIDNLELSTRSENMLHAYRNGLCSRNGNTKSVAC